MVINRLRQFVALSFSIKVDDGAPIPPHYQPPEEYRSLTYTQPIYSPSEADSHRWYPITAGLNLPLGIGKGGKKEMEIQTVKLYHTISTIGYIVNEKKTKLRPDLNQGDKKLTNECVAAARSRGETVTVEFYQPVLAYLCDTTAKVLYPKEIPYPVEESQYPHATMNSSSDEDCCCISETSIEAKSSNDYNEEQVLQSIFSCPIIMIECTYLEESFSREAERRGHVVWTFLQPIILRHFTSNESTPQPTTTFILIHFSLRYSDEEITSFFMDSTRCHLINPSQSPPNENTPPHLILWLDTGIIKLWYEF